MTTRTCQDCGREFDSLSKYRLHDCEQKRKKRADRIHLKEFGFTEGESWPVVVFHVELEQGADTMGKFDLAFAAHRDPETGERRFAFIDSDHQPIERIEYDDDLATWLDTVYEQDGYTTCINYSNAEIVDEYGRAGFVVLGRNLGVAYDWVEREDGLPPEFRNVIPRIQYDLGDARDIVRRRMSTR